MSIPTPFSDSFPLKDPPFNSRIRDQINTAKNYYMLGFKPGFPLQAQELNEIQEIFYVQQTLTLNLISNWSAGSGSGLNGAPWEGCTPLSPSLVVKTAGIPELTLKAGWYLLKDSTFASGLGVWVYKNSDSILNYTPSTFGYYGVTVPAPTIIQCTTKLPGQEAIGEDATLQDSSGLSVINGPCGSARIKMEDMIFEVNGTLKILEVNNDGSIRFINGRPIS